MPAQAAPTLRGSDTKPTESASCTVVNDRWGSY